MTTEVIRVAHEWMGEGFSDYVHVKHCRLRVTDPGPHFLYRQHGRTQVSSEPLALVLSYSNEGPMRGAARWRDLKAASIAMARVAVGIT